MPSRSIQSQPLGDLFGRIARQREADCEACRCRPSALRNRSSSRRRLARCFRRGAGRASHTVHCRAERALRRSVRASCVRSSDSGSDSDRIDSPKASATSRRASAGRTMTNPSQMRPRTRTIVAPATRMRRPSASGIDGSISSTSSSVASSCESCSRTPLATTHAADSGRARAPAKRPLRRTRRPSPSRWRPRSRARRSFERRNHLRRSIATFSVSPRPL